MKLYLVFCMLFSILGCGSGSSSPQATSYNGTWGYDDSSIKVRVALSTTDNVNYTGTLRIDDYYVGLNTNSTGYLTCNIQGKFDTATAGISVIERAGSFLIMYPSLSNYSLIIPKNPSISPFSQLTFNFGGANALNFEHALSRM
jgi:hypothetical protein